MSIDSEFKEAYKRSVQIRKEQGISKEEMLKAAVESLSEIIVDLLQPSDDQKYVIKYTFGRLRNMVPIIEEVYGEDETTTVKA